MSTSNNRTEHGILPENIKSQLRSILPKSNNINAGKGAGISEGDILCKVRGFVAACRGLPTVQVLKLNFPNEIILSESIAGTGNYRYCLRDVTGGVNLEEDRNAYQIDRVGLMNGHSTESLGSNSSATAVIPDTIQSTTNTSNSKQLDNANRIVSALRGGHKKTSTNCDNDIVVKKEPGVSSEVSINNSSQTVSSKPTSNDACASLLKKTPIEYEHEKDTIETDPQSEAKITELSEDIKAKILSILPTVGGGVEGVTLTSIKKKAPEFNNISRSLLETNLSDSMIIGSDSDGTKRYYLRAVPRGSDSVSQTAHEAKEHASTHNRSWKIIPKDPIEANIVQLLREKSSIKLNEVKGLYKTWFKKELLHTGKLKTFLGLISGVIVSKPIKIGKGKGHEYKISLSKEMLIKVKKSPAQQSTTAAVNQKVPVKLASESENTTILNKTNDKMPSDSDSQKQVDTAVNTPTEVQTHLLKLTDEQAQTATKFQPGCRVVYDIDKSLQPSSHRIQIRMGVVKSVSINLTTRQFTHEIKVSSGSILVNENDTLAYAPQSLVYYQPKNEVDAEPATVLNCFFKNNIWQYTILISSLDGELSTIVHQVTIDQLSYRSKEGDNQSEVERSKKRCHNSDDLNEEGGPAEKRAKA